LSIIVLLALAQAIEPPRTVNDAMLGDAADFVTSGPARVCVGRTSVDLIKGEKAFLDYLGIHWGAIRVVGPKGTFLVKDGDSWSQPKSADLLEDEVGRTVHRERRDGAFAYLIYGPGYYPGERNRPAAWVSGKAFRGLRDESILRRVKIAKAPKGCARSFEYGWGFLLGDPEEEAK
jgi:hypothetical protein